MLSKFILVKIERKPTKKWAIFTEIVEHFNVETFRLHRHIKGPKPVNQMSKLSVLHMCFRVYFYF